MKITNKDVIQSYIVTAAKYDFSVYEKRVLYRLVELCQPLVKGQKLNTRATFEFGMFDTHKVTLPIASFLNGETDNNYTEVKKALESLKIKSFTYEDDEVWESISIIAFPKIQKRQSFITFQIHEKVYQAILDFSKGYKKYELATAMQFKSVYAMRFYELLSGQKKPLTFSIKQLKQLFKIEDKYKSVNLFIKKVIDSAKKEMDKHSPYSFNYKLNKRGRKYESITFYPVYLPNNRDHRIETDKAKKATSIRWDLSAVVVNYLKENYLFTEQEINNNRDVFYTAYKAFDLMTHLANLRVSSSKKKNPKGYLINSIKKQLEGLKTNQKK